MIGLVLFGFLKKGIREREKNQTSLHVRRECVAEPQVSLVMYMRVGCEAGGGSEPCMDREAPDGESVNHP